MDMCSTMPPTATKFCRRSGGRGGGGEDGHCIFYLFICWFQVLAILYSYVDSSFYANIHMLISGPCYIIFICWIHVLCLYSYVESRFYTYIHMLISGPCYIIFICWFQVLYLYSYVDFRSLLYYIHMLIPGSMLYYIHMLNPCSMLIFIC